MTSLVILLTLLLTYGHGIEGNIQAPNSHPVSSTTGSAERRDTKREKCILNKKVLNCTNIQLTGLPHKIPPDIEILDLRNNEISTLAMDNLFPNVLKLFMQNNKISTGALLFEHIFPQLVELDLMGNSLSEQPGNLPETLRRLDLGRNKLTSVDLLGLQTVEELYLNSNLIKGTLSICNVHKAGGCQPALRLKTLDLSKNLIEELEDDGMSGLESLRVLSLSNNKLQVLNRKSFAGLASLTLLDLSWNLLSNIDDDMFKNLRLLKYLYLSHNKLKVIPSELPLLEWFDVSYNKITTVNETLRPTLYPIELVNLGNNPFHCDCHLLWLKEWYDRREYIIDYSEDLMPDEYIPMCATPTDLFGEHWSMLADDVFACDEEERIKKYEPTERKPIPHEEDLGLDPYAVLGENPKYIQAYDLHVQVRAVQSTAVTLEWRAPPHYTNLVIQYFLASSEVETTLFSQVQASQGHFILKNLESDSIYMICVMPKTETLSLSAPLDDCVRVKTLKSSIKESQGFFAGFLSFNIDYTFESKFKLILACFLVSIVIVATGLLLAECVLRLFLQPEKDHED